MAVVRKLVVEIGLKNLTNEFEVKGSRKGSRVLPEQHIQCIKEFYASDPISRQAPGKRDTKSVKCPETGKRILMQKRNMVMTIKEAYEDFKTKFPDIMVKKSTFFSLRPTHVLPLSQMPHNVCVCKYHANMNFLLESISKNDNFCPKTHKELLEYLCCNVSNEDCVLGKCPKCSRNKFSDLIKYVEMDPHLKLSWKQWVDGEGGIQLTVVEGSMAMAVKDVENKIPHFKTHCHVKKIQETYFEKLMEQLKKENCTETYAVVQIDFAENYSLTFQDEIQAAHWSHQQVGIFTSCVWLPNNQKKAFVVVSNDVSHSKYCVYTFLCKILSSVKTSFPFIDQVKMFSDNCTGQFKSRYTMSSMCKLQTELDLCFEWNFFASSHGKGAVDGVGATVKRHVWMAVKGNRSTYVGNAKDFYDHVSKNVKGIASFYVDKSEVFENEVPLNTYWEDVLPIPQIQSSHHFRVYDSNNILVGKTSNPSLMTKIEVKPLTDDFEEIPSVTQPKERLHYNEVYTDSEDEESPSSTQCVVPIPINDSKEIHSGIYLLINVPSLGRGKSQERMYRYAAISQGSVEDEKCLSVMFLKSHGLDKTTFIADDGDITYVNVDQIIGKLPNPSIKPKGIFTILYKFPKKIDVFEKV